MISSKSGRRLRAKQENIFLEMDMLGKLLIERHPKKSQKIHYNYNCMNVGRKLLCELQASSRVAKRVEDMLLFLFWKVKVILEHKVSSIK